MKRANLKNTISQLWKTILGKKSRIKIEPKFEKRGDKIVLILSPNASYRQYSRLAKEWTRLLDAKVTRKIETPLERLWDISFNGSEYSIFWDSLGAEMTISPSADVSGEGLKEKYLKIIGSKSVE
jgi:hypothetical protein